MINTNTVRSNILQILHKRCTDVVVFTVIDWKLLWNIPCMTLLVEAPVFHAV